MIPTIQPFLFVLSNITPPPSQSPEKILTLALPIPRSECTGMPLMPNCLFHTCFPLGIPVFKHGTHEMIRILFAMHLWMTKEFEMLWRPQMHVCQNMFSGIAVAFYVADTNICNDTISALPCLAQTLEQTSRSSSSVGVRCHCMQGCTQTMHHKRNTRHESCFQVPSMWAQVGSKLAATVQ